MLLPVILAGGVGSRLWPLSRSFQPKQFIDFPGDGGSLFQRTVQRLSGISAIAEPLVVCNQEHRFLVMEQLKELEIREARVLLEPFGRNTAPAAAMAALVAIQEDPDALLLIMPSDHVVENVSSFELAVQEAKTLALLDYLVTFGVVPSKPETGYGYVEVGQKIHTTGGYLVSSFVEKPDKATATTFLKSKNHYWNSGMFMFSARRYLEELKIYAPDIFACCTKAFTHMEYENKFLTIQESDFEQCRSDSIDYAVLENTTRAAMISLDAGWNDLGAWDSLWALQNKDELGNYVRGDVISENVRNSYIQSSSRLLAVAGVEDAIIIETPDSVLVCSQKSSQSVKQLVEKLEAGNRQEAEMPSRVTKPWGSYESLVKREGYQVKHIVVLPGESLSLQLHHRRSEYWTVIAGKGIATCDDQEITLDVNDSISIPLGSKHRLANPFLEPVEIIEVQSGDYLGEDDIERFEDKYGRLK